MKVLVREVGKTASGEFYQDVKKHINKIGDTIACTMCGNTFVIGQAELEKAKLDYKGNPKKKLDLWNESEFPFEVNLEKNPIDFSQYNTKEQVILYGVQAVYVKQCPACRENKSEFFEIEHSFGKPDRRLAE